MDDAGAERIWYIADAFRAGLSVDGVFNLTNIDRWFLVQIEELVRLEEKVAEVGITGLTDQAARLGLVLRSFQLPPSPPRSGLRFHAIRSGTKRVRYSSFPHARRFGRCFAGGDFWFADQHRNGRYAHYYGG